MIRLTCSPLFQHAGWLPLLTGYRCLASTGAARTTAEQPLRQTQLSAWLSDNHATPPVRLLKGMQQPTALSWLRRRGPDVPIGMLYKLFRNRLVRVYSPEKATVSRVSRARVMQESEVLLFPKQLSPSKASSSKTQAQSSTYKQAESASNVRVDVRGLVLHETPDFFFINKPGGIAVQGHGPDCLDSLLGGLKRRSADEPPRLVHRLDQRVSGLLLLAKNADAAAWASACFRDKAAEGLLLLEEERLQARARLGLPPKASPWPVPSREDLPEGLSIFRLYWALVHGTFKAGQRGSITLPVPLPAGGGPARPAITLYRVLAASAGLSWVELVPLTGRRHQLRYHCGKALAPIVGDERYGFEGLQKSEVVTAAALPEPWWHSYRSPARAQVSQGNPATGNAPIMLHSRLMRLSIPGQPLLKVSAPLPAHMAALMRANGWDEDEGR